MVGDRTEQIKNNKKALPSFFPHQKGREWENGRKGYLRIQSALICETWRKKKMPTTRQGDEVGSGGIVCSLVA